MGDKIIIMTCPRPSRVGLKIFSPKGVDWRLCLGLESLLQNHAVINFLFLRNRPLGHDRPRCAPVPVVKCVAYALQRMLMRGYGG
jgi:hypothetical protein